MWYIAFFAKNIGAITHRQVGIIAVSAILMYEFYYIGLYSIPRTTISQVAILYLCIVISLFIGKPKFDVRWGVVLILFGLAIVFYHKVGILRVCTILRHHLFLVDSSSKISK